MRDLHQKQWYLAFAAGKKKTAEHHRLEFIRYSEKVMEWCIETGRDNEL
jgi:hypothetical protein